MGILFIFLNTFLVGSILGADSLSLVENNKTQLSQNNTDKTKEISTKILHSFGDNEVQQNSEPLKFTISLLPEIDELFKAVDTFISKPQIVENIEFSSDCSIDQNELKNLTSIEIGSLIDDAKIKKAIIYLKKKKKFEIVTLLINQTKDGKLQIKFLLKSAWVFSKLKCNGSIPNKERLEQFYNIEFGELFDIIKHRYYINTIEKELKNDGYFKIKIIDSINYDTRKKTVSVNLDFTNTDVFVIDKVSLKINSPNAQVLDLKVAKTDISLILNKELQNCDYSKELMDQQKNKIKELLLNKGYINPKIETKLNINENSKRVDLIFNINILNQKQFLFKGNNFFSSNELLNELLVIGDSAMLIPASLLAEDIIALYKNKGFWSVKIKWNENSDNFLFEINEGPRATIVGLELHKIPDQLECHNFFKQTIADIKMPFPFDDTILKSIINKLIIEYKSLGYWDAEIAEPIYKKVKNKKQDYVITLNVKLGYQRLLNCIRIKGFEHFHKLEAFEKYQNLNKPIPFDYSIIQNQKIYLTRYLINEGYLQVTVLPHLIPVNNGLDLEWRVQTGVGLVKIGKTIITGNSSVLPQVIQRELCYVEGDIFNKDSIERSLKRLRSLDIFDSVNIETETCSNEANKKNVIIKCADDDPFEVRTRIGFSQVSKSFTNISMTSYVLGGSLLWKNPRNIADILRFDADLTRYSRDVSFSYEVPWLWSLPLRTLSTVYTVRYEQPLINHSHARLYKEAHDGISVSLTPYFGELKNLNTLGFEWTKLSDISAPLAKAIDFEYALVDKRIPTLYFESSLALDKLDNSVNPTKGFHTFLSAQGVFPFNVKQGHFIKLLFEQSFVHPIYKSVIGALRFRAGHIFNAKFSTILPTERFYLGGSSTLRGYETNMAPPINSFIAYDNKISWAPIGGKSMVNINAELRFPIYKNLGGVIFNDMGILAQDKLADIGSKWLGVTGFGLRYSTPIGPVRFDIGWKWKKRDPKDRSFAWFLTLGHSF